MDFEFYQDTLHVACKRTIATDTVNLFLKLRADKWISFYEKKLSFEKFRTADTLSFNSLCSEGTAMNVGGYFFYAPIIGTVGINCMSYGSYWVNVDSTVNKMVLFKGDLIIGGKFKTGFTYNEKGGVTEELNGITKRMPWKLNINNETKLENQLSIYPNPLASGGKLKIGNDFVGKEYCLRSIDGKECNKGKVSSNNEIQLPTVASGIYIIEVQNAQGQKATSRLNVE
jgi:hypothetical protein